MVKNSNLTNARDSSKTLKSHKLSLAGNATPFIKWVGGKRSIMDEIVNRLPQDFNHYYEPFLGGGALFYEMKSQGILLKKTTYLSDINFDLVITYTVVQSNIEILIEYLKIHVEKHCDEYYYQIRSHQNILDPVERAARFIYLNKTCFNGLWRVNRKNEFNVPLGSYKKPGILQENNIRACHLVLRENVFIQQQDFTEIKASQNDFVYFDPPYNPKDETSFTKYSKMDFTEKDQIRLRDFAIALHQKGAKVMLSNSDTKLIRDIYGNSIFNIFSVKAPRLVNCKPHKRNAVNELLITNY